jgi:hypothetical protein
MQKRRRLSERPWDASEREARALAGMDGDDKLKTTTTTTTTTTAPSTTQTTTPTTSTTTTAAATTTRVKPGQKMMFIGKSLRARRRSALSSTLSKKKK